MTASTGRDSDKFMLRLPDGMRDRISASAKANNRSMNAEIIDRLEASYTDDRALPLAGTALDALEETLAQTRELIASHRETIDTVKVLKLAIGEVVSHDGHVDPGLMSLLKAIVAPPDKEDAN